MKVSAPAKINLTLEVTGLEKNGYHTIDTLFAWLELEDTLEFTPAAETSLEMSVEGVSAKGIALDETNLVIRALRALEKTVGKDLSTHIRLTKRIPAGGGLGGGSADAAATLIGINLVHSLGFGQKELLDLARPLGADVAFGLVGGFARGTQYGDILEPQRATLLECPVVLLFPSLACSTPKVYKLWDERPSREANGATERFLVAKDFSERMNAISNDLEEPAFALHPELRNLKKRMIEAGLQGVCLSGSGSTLFGFLGADTDFNEIQERLSDLHSKILLTRLKEGTRFELVS